MEYSRRCATAAGSLLLIFLCAFTNTAMCSPCGASEKLPTVNLTLVMQRIQKRADQISYDANRLTEFLTVGNNPWIPNLNKPAKGIHYPGFPYDFQGTFEPQANVTEMLFKDYVFLLKLRIFYEELGIITDCSTRTNKSIAQSIINSVLTNCKLALGSIDTYLNESGHCMPDTQIPTRDQVLDDTRLNTYAPDLSNLTDCKVSNFISRSQVTYVIARDTEATCTRLCHQLHGDKQGENCRPLGSN